jgi:hypothetical protein
METAALQTRPLGTTDLAITPAGFGSRVSDSASVHAS